MNELLSCLGSDGSALTNSSCSPLSAAPGSPPTTLFYNPQTFDTIFLPPAPAAPFSGQFLPTSSGYAANPTGYRLVNSSAGQEQSSSSSSINESLALNSALPPGTSFCLCGCGELAMSPARYAPHHHAALGTHDQTNAPPHGTHSSNQDVSGSPFHSRAATPSALFPVSADFLGEAAETATTPQNDPSAAAGLDSTPPRTKRASEHSSEFFDPQDEKKRLRSSTIERPIRSDNNDGHHNVGNAAAAAMSNAIDPSHSSSNATFPFVESWMKCYSPYSSYPAHEDGNGNQRLTLNNEDEASSIAALLGHVASDADRFREAMLLLTSSGSSTGEGPPDLNAADEFSMDQTSATTSSTLNQSIDPHRSSSSPLATEPVIDSYNDSSNNPTSTIILNSQPVMVAQQTASS